jgi:hypothetical protein
MGGRPEYARPIVAVQLIEEAKHRHSVVMRDQHGFA